MKTIYEKNKVCERLGITRRALNRRMEKGMTFEEASKTPARSRKTRADQCAEVWFSKILGHSMVASRGWFTQREIAKDLGCKTSTLRVHVRRLVELEQLEADYYTVSGVNQVRYRLRSQFTEYLHGKWRKTDNSWLDLPDQFGVAR